MREVLGFEGGGNIKGGKDLKVGPAPRTDSHSLENSDHR